MSVGVYWRIVRVEFPVGVGSQFGSAVALGLAALAGRC